MQQQRRFTPLDAILLILLAAGLGYFFWRAHVEFQYEWNWSLIPQFLFRHDPQDGWVPNVHIQGLITTVRLSIWATLLASLIGIVMGVARTSQGLFWRLISKTYVEVVRNLPPLVLVFIFYFFIYSLIAPLIGIEEMVRTMPDELKTVLSYLCAPPNRLPGFISGVVTLAVYEGAYITEIIRGGIESISRGQWEASASLGFGRLDQMRLVILPQAMKVIIPPMAGQFISTIKDSAIVSVISIQELTFQGLELMAATYLTFEVWITITLLYLVLTLGCSFVAARLERSLSWRF